MQRDACLKRRLLFASVQAYHPGDLARTGNPQWLEAPAPVQGGRSTFLLPPWAEPQFDFALVGRVPEGIVVAFRGTLPPFDLAPDCKTVTNPDILGLPVLLDWQNNFQAELDPGAMISQVRIAGAIHKGFGASLAGLWAGIAAKVDQLRGADDSPHLYFTGHSKGGALANLAALCARSVWRNAAVKAATFGAPHVGDHDFAQAYQAASIDCQRYEVDGDMVPHVPVAGFVAGSLGFHKFEPVGTPYDVSPIYYPPPPPPSNFLDRISAAFASSPGDDRSRIPHVIAAHLAYRGFGYGENVCEPGCPHSWR
jgi:hypothetical protein